MERGIRYKTETGTITCLVILLTVHIFMQVVCCRADEENTPAAPVMVREICILQDASVVWNIKTDSDTAQLREEDSAAWIGDAFQGEEKACTVRMMQAGEEGAPHCRTAILMDNSLSIPEGNREKIRELLRALFQSHGDREEFWLYTFSTAPVLRGEGTDYAALTEISQAIPFENQDSYLVDCIAQVLERMGESRASCGGFDRLIVISDGADDNRAGRTYADLLDMLTDDRFCCPVYTVTSLWERDFAGLKNLVSLSKKTGAKTFALEEADDPVLIAAQIGAPPETQLAVVKIPAGERQGAGKTIRLKLSTTEGEYEAVRRLELPEMTAGETVESEAMETEAGRMVTESGEEETEALSEGKAGRGRGREESMRHIPWLAAGAGFLAAGMFFGTITLIRKRKIRRSRSALPANMGPALRREATAEYAGAAGNSPPAQYPEREMTVAENAGYGAQPSDQTIGMWEPRESCSEQRIILTDVEDRRKRYEVRLRGEASMGRDSLCTLVLQGDPTVSGLHCRLIRQGPHVIVEDLHSRNGTAVNGKRILKTSVLQTEDVLALGATRLRVEIVKTGS